MSTAQHGSAVMIGVASTGALALWLLGRLQLDADPGLVGASGFEALLVVQFLAAWAVTPWLADEASVALADAGLMLATAWPLLVLITQLSEIVGSSVLLSQLFGFGIAALSVTTLSALRRRAPREIVAAWVVLPALLIWYAREDWLIWLV